jgi:hypothetical protein
MLDQIKDSGRMVVDVAQASEYYYYEGTLQANQYFYGPVLNTQGKARAVLSAQNVPGSPGSISFGVYISHQQDFNIFIPRFGQSTTAGSNYHNSDYLPAQFCRAYAVASSTSGTYSYRIWLAIHPVS